MPDVRNAAQHPRTGFIRVVNIVISVSTARQSRSALRSDRSDIRECAAAPNVGLPWMYNCEHQQLAHTANMRFSHRPNAVTAWHLSWRVCLPA
jgi:hypothetical protein